MKEKYLPNTGTVLEVNAVDDGRFVVLENNLKGLLRVIAIFYEEDDAKVFIRAKHHRSAILSKASE